MCNSHRGVAEQNKSGILKALKQHPDAGGNGVLQAARLGVLGVPVKTLLIRQGMCVGNSAGGSEQHG